MNTSNVTTHTVTIYQSDFLAWLSASAASLILSSAELRFPVVNDGRKLEIIFPVSQNFLDTFLRKTIDNLPQFGLYKLNVVNDDTIVGYITWQT